MDLEVICSHISWSVLNLWEKVIFLTGLLPAPRGGGPAVCSAPYRVIFIRGGCVHCQQLVLNSQLFALAWQRCEYEVCGSREPALHPPLSVYLSLPL